MVPFSRASINILFFNRKKWKLFLSIFTAPRFAVLLCDYREISHFSHYIISYLFSIFIYLCDTVISCLVYYNFLPSAWFYSSRVLLLAFPFKILNALLPVSGPAFEWPSWCHCLSSIPLSPEQLLSFKVYIKQTIKIYSLFFFTFQNYCLLSVYISSFTHNGKCICNNK